MIFQLVPEDASEREVVERLNLDWLMYGEVHVTSAPNGHGITRLDPIGIVYSPPETFTDDEHDALVRRLAELRG